MSRHAEGEMPRGKWRDTKSRGGDGFDALSGGRVGGRGDVLCDIPFSILIRIAMRLGRQKSGVQHSGEHLTPHPSNEHVWRT